MSLPTAEDLLKELRKKEVGLSTVLNFDELIQSGILARKKGTKTMYELLRPDKLPEEAWAQISEEITFNEKKTTYIKFISEKQRNKRLADMRKILKNFS
jgi:hypothetical protein